ncbi:MAG TPA: hypothetical protein VM690_00675 [Gaiellaceae bacterium]|nr:hypothetical protein [Gaiellaceae bacterium]
MLALACIVVFGVMTGAVAIYATSNLQASSNSRGAQTALALAEAGLNMAYSTLEQSTTPSSQTALSSTPVPDIAMVGGTATYDGTLSGTTWTLTGIGKVAGAPGYTIARVAHGKASIGTGSIGGASNAAWKYIYADDPNSCATLSNNTSVDVPLYVRGSLCLSNSATIDGPALQVGGTVTLNGTQTRIGSSGSPMAEVHVGRGCSLTGIVFDTPCTSADRVYGNTVDANVAPLTEPPVDLAGWYRNAMPGPMHGCTIGSFPGGFDTNGVLDESRGTVDLAPKTAYDCRVYDDGGNLVGQITWTPGAPGTLTVLGTIFFDGNISFSQLSQVDYQGRATIYASGTISVANQTAICPVTGCNASWDPNTNMLAFVAGSLRNEATGFTIGNNSTFEGAVYCVNDYSAGNNTTMWGPVVARQISISNSSLNDFPPIWNLMPGMPSSYQTVTTVSIVPGSWSS